MPVNGDSAKGQAVTDLDLHRDCRKRIAELEAALTGETNIAPVLLSAIWDRDKALCDLKEERARLLAVCHGCHDYGGGYKEPQEAEIYHHGIQTVINALTAALKHDPLDTQINALARIGRASIEAARKGDKQNA